MPTSFKIAGLVPNPWVRAGVAVAAGATSFVLFSTSEKVGNPLFAALVIVGFTLAPLELQHRIARIKLYEAHVFINRGKVWRLILYEDIIGVEALGKTLEIEFHERPVDYNVPVKERVILEEAVEVRDLLRERVRHYRERVAALGETGPQDLIAKLASE